MTWLKIGDEFLEDETIGALRDRTFRLHVKGLVYCARNNTDGHLSKRAVKMLQALLGFQVKTNVAELVATGLWMPVDEATAISDGTVFDDGYAVKNFLKYNPPRVEVREEREKARNRSKAARAKAKEERERSDKRSVERLRTPTRPDPKKNKGFSLEPAGDAVEQPWDLIQLREIA